MALAAGTTASPLNTQAWVDLNKIDLNEVHMVEGMEKPREYTFYLKVETLDHQPATDQQVHGTGLMPRKPEGEAYPRQNLTLGGRKTWSALPRGNAVEITFEERQDEQYGTIRDIPRDQARAGRQAEEEDAVSVLDNAFSTSFVGFAAGESLCSTAHTSDVDGSSQANRPNPDVGFSLTGLQQMTLHSHNLKHDDGKRMLMQFDLVIISPNDLFLAREILGSVGRPFTADNELNSMIAEELSWLVSHFKSSTTSWFGISRDGHDMHMKWRTRPFQDTYVDPNTGNAVSAHYQRHTLGEFRDWRGVYGSTG